MTDANSPSHRSWINVAPESDFPIQNLPFGIISRDTPRAAVAIGAYAIDLAELQSTGLLDTCALPPGIFQRPYLNDFFSLGKSTIRQVRERLSQLLRDSNDELKDRVDDHRRLIVPMNEVQLLLPVRVSNYTDFYSSSEHATNVGSMFRDPKNALLPNWKHLPVAYHGRASSIVVSGTSIHRPKGQIKPPDAYAPVFSPSRKLDFELEMAFITCSDTALGTSISTEEAMNHIAGFVLFNDWSARDIQQWEYAPLGPFLGKNFGSTMSPWVVTADALEPFKVDGPSQHPPVLGYLRFRGSANYDINLQVDLASADFNAVTLCRSNTKYLYWNVLQQLAHHTINGCNIRVGDVYASGTISGPDPGSYGSLLELSWNGTKPLQLSDKVTRTFLEDGDIVTMKGYASRNGVRIGFGECTGKIVSG